MKLGTVVDFDPTAKYPMRTHLKTEVAPGIFRRGTDCSDEGAKISFQGIVNAKNVQKIVCHLPTGAGMLRQGL